MLLFNELPTVCSSTPTSLNEQFSSKRALLITHILENINVLRYKFLVIKKLFNIFGDCFFTLTNCQQGAE